MAKKSAGWWFQTFFILQNVWDNPSHWLSYFSRWLKPPISQFWYWSNFQNSRWHCWWKLQLPRWRWSILAWLWSTTMACGSRLARKDNKGARWGSSWTQQNFRDAEWIEHSFGTFFDSQFRNFSLKTFLFLFQSGKIHLHQTRQEICGSPHYLAPELIGPLAAEVFAKKKRWGEPLLAPGKAM